MKTRNNFAVFQFQEDRESANEFSQMTFLFVLVVRVHQQGLRVRLHHLIGFPPSGHRHFSLFQVLTTNTTTTTTAATKLTNANKARMFYI